MGLEVGGRVQLEVGFEWKNFVIGVDKNDGFYLGTSTVDELTIFVRAKTPGLSVRGKLGPLEMQATDGADLNLNGTLDATETSVLVATLKIDLRDPTNDGRLTMTELTNVGAFSQIVAAHFIRCRMRTRRISSCIWTWESATLVFRKLPPILPCTGVLKAVIQLPPPRPLAIHRRSGSAIFRLTPGKRSRVLRAPILDQINSVLAPVKPFIQVLQTPLPIISQIAGRDFTLLDFAEVFGGKVPPSTKKFIKALKDLDNVVSIVSSISATGMIPLGQLMPDVFPNGKAEFQIAVVAAGWPICAVPISPRSIQPRSPTPLVR